MLTTKNISLLIISFVVLTGCARNATQVNDTGSVNETSATPEQNTRLAAEWSFNGEAWESSGTPPTCPDPIELKSPVDLSEATAILYPGQTRGGNYKPHGGFRFDGTKDNAVTVTAPMDAKVVRGARYIEQDEIQYLFEFVNACGIMYRFDHLNALSQRFQELADQLPAPQKDDSRTNNIETETFVTAGEEIATKVGFVQNNNTSLDWGVYDLRSQNQASQTTNWATEYRELAAYGVCWFDYLSTADEATVRALPAGDQQSGKTSDYCE